MLFFLIVMMNLCWYGFTGSQFLHSWVAIFIVAVVEFSIEMGIGAVLYNSPSETKCREKHKKA